MRGGGIGGWLTEDTRGRFVNGSWGGRGQELCGAGSMGGGGGGGKRAGPKSLWAAPFVDPLPLSCRVMPLRGALHSPSTSTCTRTHVHAGKLTSTLRTHSWARKSLLLRIPGQHPRHRHRRTCAGVSSHAALGAHPQLHGIPHGAGEVEGHLGARAGGRGGGIGASPGRLQRGVREAGVLAGGGGACGARGAAHTETLQPGRPACLLGLPLAAADCMPLLPWSPCHAQPHTPLTPPPPPPPPPDPPQVLSDIKESLARTSDLRFNEADNANIPTVSYEVRAGGRMCIRVCMRVCI